MSIITGRRLNYFFQEIQKLFLQKKEKAVSASTADSATKAKQDEYGNVIYNTYAKKSIYGNDHVSFGRRNGTVVGENSVALGVNTAASGYCSHAEGGNTTASEHYSHAEGSTTTASGYGSHAEGSGTTASGSSSHAEGSATTASGYYSHAEGINTTAQECQHVQGHWNDTSKAKGGTVSGKGEGTAFCIGNGTSTTGSNCLIPHLIDS